ncbi:MAG: aminopeptidase [Candidatus Omnitrophica bacterium]|nr:aminopeptidase [Candidatus Omnitrophota bacterium]MDD5487772.1 aminopeptidase [Candidatus Omnitrophota bacterium]
MIRDEAVKAVFEGSLKLKNNESCLIVTDTIKEPIGKAFHEYAKKRAARSSMMVIEPTLEHATEPPRDVADEMLEFDVEILVTEKSLTHTRARREATRRGARIATMPGITEDIANRCLDIDYEELKKESGRIYGILKASGEIRVTTQRGTDMRFTVGRSGFFGAGGGSFDVPGAYGNLPEGEVAFAPEECDGVFIVDATWPEIGILDEPIKFVVSDGYVTDISGKYADEVRDRLDRVGKKAYKVAELGIGLNPKATLIGQVLEDEKVIGTVHIALGNDMSFGGSNDVPLHLDGVIRTPDITVDGVRLMVNGKFIG